MSMPHAAFAGGVWFAGNVTVVVSLRIAADDEVGVVLREHRSQRREAAAAAASSSCRSLPSLARG